MDIHDRACEDFNNVDKELGLAGLVLVGGESSRMKQPKAHLVIHDLPQWQYCQQVLSPLGTDVYFSVSPRLSPPIAAPFKQIIEDIFVEPQGPLGGIISAFKKLSDSAFFILACDLPYFDQGAVSYLLSQRKPKKKATVFVHEGHIEPLCGIYEPAIFDDLLKYWAMGTLCPRVILSKLDIEKIEPGDPRWLTNINHVHELAPVVGAKIRRSVTVHFYASLREEVGRGEENFVTAATTVGELFLDLQRRHSLKTAISELRFALNNRLVTKDALINDKDAIVFIPPVCGG